MQARLGLSLADVTASVRQIDPSIFAALQVRLMRTLLGLVRMHACARILALAHVHACTCVLAHTYLCDDYQHV